MKRRIFEKIAFSMFTLLMVFSLLGLGLYVDLKDDLPQLPDSLDKPEFADRNLFLPRQCDQGSGSTPSGALKRNFPAVYRSHDRDGGFPVLQPQWGRPHWLNTGHAPEYPEYEDLARWKHDHPATF